MAADSLFRPKVDRRTFSLGALMALTAACNTAPSQGRAQQVNDPFWTLWRDRFVAPEGRVVDTGNGRISHSEGQSYGMILALRAGDREAFERIAKWTQDTLGREDMALIRLLSLAVILALAHWARRSLAPVARLSGCAHRWRANGGGCPPPPAARNIGGTVYARNATPGRRGNQSGNQCRAGVLLGCLAARINGKSGPAFPRNEKVEGV